MALEPNLDQDKIPNLVDQLKTISKPKENQNQAITKQD